MSVSLEEWPAAATIDAMPRSSPTSRRFELSARLKQARINASVTVEEAAEALGCSTDKIHWMERADWTDPKWRDVRDLLDRYGVTNEAEREELIDLAKTGGEPDWWQPYSKTLSRRRSKFSAYLGRESDATEVNTYELAVIPGLLQTEAYAKALLEHGPDEIDQKEIAERIEVRAQRQRILAGDGAARLWAVIDEAALRREIGGPEAPEVMPEQIRHLIEVSKRPNVTLQVLPFSAGAHPSLSGSFTVLSFDRGYPDVAYIEAIGGELLMDRTEAVDRYRRVFRHLNVMALNPEDTIAMLVTEVAGA